MENSRQKIELADILRKNQKGYYQQYKLCPQQKKVYEVIINCRTIAMGGHINQCDLCGYNEQSYNSCRDRHCPKCQLIKQAQWVDKLKANLLPVRYFHLVFTIPRCLHKTFYINQKRTYGLLFNAAVQALNTAAANPKYLGAQTGAVTVLHTWGQTLSYHPHIHMLVPAGGLSEDEMEWISCGKNFFLPVKVLSVIFRGILIKKLAKAIADREVRLPYDIRDIKQLNSLAYKKQWVVYAKKPLAGPDKVIEYLGNYTHRVAISNHRIIKQKKGRITFRYKDNRSGMYHKEMTIDALDFIHRFLFHVLPSGFYKIRYFGILAPRNARTKKQKCQNLIDSDCYLPLLEGLNAIEVYQHITGKKPGTCPQCQNGRLLHLPLKTEKLIRAG